MGQNVPGTKLPKKWEKMYPVQNCPTEVSYMEIKNIKTSKLDNKELLEVQKQVESFLKFLNSEYDTVKKLEEENS